VTRGSRERATRHGEYYLGRLLPTSRRVPREWAAGALLVLRKWALLALRNVIVTAEDRIHIALLAVLGAANVAIYAHGPVDTAPSSAFAESPSALSRPDLEGAIQRLEGWLARERTQARPGIASELALQGLGPNAEDRAHPERWLARLLGTSEPATLLAMAAPGADRHRLLAALVVLLEAGVPLDRPLTSSAEKNPALTNLKQLVDRALDSAEPRVADDALDPSELDLLSFAVLGGMKQYQGRLAELTHRALARLDRQHRDRGARPGAGQLDEKQLEDWAREWRAEAGPESSPHRELLFSSAVFRATAVLADRELEPEARRHLNRLLLAYPSQRALYRHLLGTARNAAERTRVELDAVERLGRLEEALYSAHLSFRRGSQAAPGGATAEVMRLAARDLLDQLPRLTPDDSEDAPDRDTEARRARLRAAVQALRGLRAARVAG
jgi:hypothetical protein